MKALIEKEFKIAEIDEIPKEWNSQTLSEVADINKDSVDPTKEFLDRKFLYIDIDSVENGTGVIKGAKEIIGKDAPSRARRVIHYNDVLMSTVRPYLKAFAIVPRVYDNQICSTGFAVLTSKKQILPLYLLYTLFTKTVIEQCQKMMRGGQYPALNASQVAGITIPLPPLPEQQKIAEILSTVDEAIAKVDEAIRKTEKLKKGLMRRLFTKGIGHKEFRETEIGKIPKDWKKVKLRAIALVRYGLGQPPELDNNGVPMIRATNINRGKILTNGLIRIKRSAIPNSRNPFLREGDILVVRSGAYTGDIALVTKQWAGSVAGYDLIVTPSEAVDSNFLTDFLLSDVIQKYFVAQSVRAAQPHLNSQQVEETPTVVPPIAEQKKIAIILGAVDEKLELLAKKKGQFEKIKKALMNDLLTGRKRVKTL